MAAVVRQGRYFAVGYVVMILGAQISLQRYTRWAPWLYLVGVAMLLGVMFFGVGAKGAQRWLEIGGFRFQPSEIMKLVVPMAVAWYLADRILPPTFKHVMAGLALVVIPAGLILQQPDLGTSLLIAASGLFVLFVAGIGWRYILGALLLAVASAWPAWAFVLKDYQKQRILTMLNPESDKLGAGWNIIQSKTAIGSGGWEGKGWMSGTQSQRFSPGEPHRLYYCGAGGRVWFARRAVPDDAVCTDPASRVLDRRAGPDQFWQNDCGKPDTDILCVYLC